MNIKTELNEILKTSSLFSNIGNNISNEIIYPIKYLKDINDIPKIIDGTKYVNSEVEIINNLRSQLFDKYGQIGLKELNLFIKDVKLALKDFSNIFEKYYNGDQFENVMILINSYLINYFIEYFVNEKCETEFHFFSDIIDIYKNGNLVVGCFFKKNLSDKIYNIFSYPVDAHNTKKNLNDNVINLVVI